MVVPSGSLDCEVISLCHAKSFKIVENIKVNPLLEDYEFCEHWNAIK
jgi:hypothetical protein